MLKGIGRDTNPFCVFGGLHWIWTEMSLPTTKILPVETCKNESFMSDEEHFCTQLNI